MNTARRDCQRIRRELLQRTCDGSVEKLPAIVQSHLDGCSGCARYCEGLRAAPELFHGPALYTSELRQRTLRAAQQMPVPTERWVLAGLIPLALSSLLLSFIGPIWLGSRILEHWISSPMIAGFTALSVVTLLGAVSSCVCAATLIRHREGIFPSTNSRMEECNG